MTQFALGKGVIVCLCLSLYLNLSVVSGLNVIYAVNCGGDRHTDSSGVVYSKDTLNVGIGSEHGKSLIIARVPDADKILYQTERYHYDDFSYDVPIREDGEYVLVLKFSEVYFQNAGEKVFSVRLNGAIMVVEDLDILSAVGYATAHEEYIPFTVKGNVLEARGGQTAFSGKLVVEFLKGSADNPKINAIVVFKGKEDSIPKLEPLPKYEPEDVVEEEPQESQRKFKKTSGPKVNNPYESDESWFWPLSVVIAIFLPIIFCLCRH